MDRRSFMQGMSTLLVGSDNKLRVDPGMFQVILRTVMDTEQMVFRSMGMELKREDQIECYKVAAQMVRDGADAFDPDFWTRVADKMEQKTVKLETRV